MRQFPKNKHFKYLIFLHYCGLISLPDYHRSALLNWFHGYIYRSIVYATVFGGTCLFIYSILVFSSHDLNEFMQRSLECLYILTFLPEIFIFNLRLQSFLNLLDMMDQHFTDATDSLRVKYEKEETLSRRLILFFCISLYLIVLTETLWPQSEQMLSIQVRIYHVKHPHRRLPAPLQLFIIDSSDFFSYWALFVYEFYMLFVLLVSVAQCSFIEMVFSTPVVEQYERFYKYVVLIGCEHRNERGETVYFTDLQTGHYIEEIGPDRSLAEVNSVSARFLVMGPGGRKKRTEERYREFFIRKLLLRHQQLNAFIAQYKVTVGSCIDVILIPSVLLVPLSTYQLSLIPTMPLLTSGKILFEYLFLAYGIAHLVYESEKLDTCSQLVVKAIGNSHWYQTTAGIKKKVALMLRSSQDENILALCGRTIVLEYPFLLRVARVAFSFVNFMHLVGNIAKA